MVFMQERSGPMPRRRFTYAGGGKRVLDLALGLPLLLLLAPLILVLLGLVALDGAAPIYGHERVGRGGRRFRCWKIRSMVPDADTRLAALLANDPAAAAEWAEGAKLADDPRVTRLGRALRRSSLDELPQLWNVIRGEMSLVGPRPVPADELAARYGVHAATYASLAPGLTGPWQAGDRNALPYDARVRLDVAYARGPSFSGDLRLLLLTAGAVVRRTGW